MTDMKKASLKTLGTKLGNIKKRRSLEWDDWLAIGQILKAEKERVPNIEAALKHHGFITLEHNYPHFRAALWTAEHPKQFAEVKEAWPRHTSIKGLYAKRGVAKPKRQEVVVRSPEEIKVVAGNARAKRLDNLLLTYKNIKDDREREAWRNDHAGFVRNMAIHEANTAMSITD